MADYVIDAAVRNSKGNIRHNNEDSFYLNGIYMSKKAMDQGGLFKAKCDRSGQIYAVCDGMGGEAAGEEASFAAVKSIAGNTAILNDFHQPRKLTQFIRNISDVVYELAHSRNARSGCTLAMVLIKSGMIRILHVGDSRVYCMQSGKLTRLTKDHSEVQRMISLGIITPQEAREHPKRHVISQYLGMSSQDIRIDPDITDPLPLSTGDRYVLCSDGLTDMVEDDVIERILANASSASEASDALVRQALKNGGRDNVTVLTLFIGSASSAIRKVCMRALDLLLTLGGLAMLVEWIYRMF